MLSKYTDTYFFTATINSWQKLLRPDGRKEIILDALKYLVQNETIMLHAYVIMPNHIHLILTLTEQTNFRQFQLSLLRYSTKAIIRDMKKKEETDELLNYSNYSVPPKLLFFLNFKKIRRVIHINFDDLK